MKKRMLLAAMICLSGALNTGCWWDRYFYTSVATIRTWTQEEDLFTGVTLFYDPYRGYYGYRTTAVEKYGYTSASGTTNGSSYDVRNNLSVPNKWTFSNQNGPCASQVTYDDRLVHAGTANLKCRVYTGYNHSQYTTIALEGETVDGDSQYVTDPTDLGTNFLWPDESVYRNQALRDGYGNYQLVLLDDGQLVQLYNGNDGQWDAGVSGGDHLIMQLDGNLVLYSGSTPLWHSGTAGNPGAYLNVQDDGNLVVYSSGDVPLWSRW